MLPVKKIRRKTGEGTQYAALCYRARKGRKVEILLVTSRKTGRWIPPKGWPMKGKSPEKAAAQEAFEEAGVKGQVYDFALGRYRYKRENGVGKPSDEAYIFPLEVEKLAKRFKEKGQRKIKWFSPKKAAMLVREPKLKKIIREFDPKLLKAG
ncbi:MAG: NUDIX hydrolase [Alphaproteobacteria bacterium]|nr:NUDIX hydrolase [Alphaproteobacteria bacterium]